MVNQITAERWAKFLLRRMRQAIARGTRYGTTWTPLLDLIASVSWKKAILMAMLLQASVVPTAATGYNDAPVVEETLETNYFQFLGKTVSTVSYTHVLFDIDVDQAMIALNTTEQALQSTVNHCNEEANKADKSVGHKRFWKRRARVNQWKQEEVASMQQRMEAVTASTKDSAMSTRRRQPRHPAVAALGAIGGMFINLWNTVELHRIRAEVEHLRTKTARHALKIEANRVNTNRNSKNIQRLDETVRWISIQTLVNQKDAELFQAADFVITQAGITLDVITAGIDNRLAAGALVTAETDNILRDVQTAAREMGDEMLITKGWELLKCKVSLLPTDDNKSITAFIHVPSVEPGDLLDMYRYISLPVQTPEGINLQVKMDNNVIAMDRRTRSSYRVMSDAQFLSCEALGEILICPNANVVTTTTDIDTRTGSDICLVSMWSQDYDNARRTCTMETVTPDLRAVQVGPNVFLVSTMTETPAWIRCPKQEPFRISINGNTKLTLREDCILTTPHHRLKPVAQRMARNDQNFGFNWDESTKDLLANWRLDSEDWLEVNNLSDHAIPIPRGLEELKQHLIDQQMEEALQEEIGEAFSQITSPWSTFHIILYVAFGLMILLALAIARETYLRVKKDGLWTKLEEMVKPKPAAATKEEAAGTRNTHDRVLETLFWAEHPVASSTPRAPPRHQRQAALAHHDLRAITHMP